MLLTVANMIVSAMCRHDGNSLQTKWQTDVLQWPDCQTVDVVYVTHTPTGAAQAPNVDSVHVTAEILSERAGRVQAS